MYDNNMRSLILVALMRKKEKITAKEVKILYNNITQNITEADIKAFAEKVKKLLN